ncbi:MAG TPA: VTT domain-containing protein [Bryobacteraceae bacterium]|nr:VTT domain-containing protein [Bryobacteraceae bacterium]
MRPLLQKIAAVLLTYGPWGVLLLSAIDSVGVPLPAAMDVWVIGVAAASAKAPREAWLTALMAVVGSVCGNIILFKAAEQGRRLFGKGEPEPGKRQRFQEWFNRYGLLTVFVPAVTPFIPLPLKVFVISAGALRTSLPKFLGVILLARVIRYFGEAWLGLQLGADAQGFLTRNGWTLAAIAVAMSLALYFLIRYNDARRPAPRPPVS